MKLTRVITMMLRKTSEHDDDEDVDNGEEE
jgi:hypothetical protein